MNHTIEQSAEDFGCRFPDFQRKFLLVQPLFRVDALERDLDGTIHQIARRGEVLDAVEQQGPKKSKICCSESVYNFRVLIPAPVATRQKASDNHRGNLLMLSKARMWLLWPSQPRSRSSLGIAAKGAV
jgi:hypothetical protein